ncbi:MAG TPA: hypothetical protein VEP90_29620, partial [Methylomirabilota bacterium]|nr:hypothetical protein [Methylomirabilota bacterium]
FIRIFRVQQYCGCYTSIYSQDDCVFLRSKMEDSRLDRVLFGPFLYDWNCRAREMRMNRLFGSSAIP